MTRGPAPLDLGGRFRRNRSGSVLPIFAITSMLLLGVTAFSVDYGLVFLAKRRAQSAADLAALVATQSLPTAEAAARTSLADNGIADGVAVLVEPGSYVADAGVAAAQRFSPASGVPNAVRVTLTTAASLVFGRLLTGQSSIAIGARATAARADAAIVTIGSRVASVDGGLANALLGAMLGTTLTLSAGDYRALASARIDAFRFLDALAVSLDLRAVSYGRVLQSSATVAQVGAALASASRDSGNSLPVATALGGLSAAVAGDRRSVPLGRLLSVGDFGGQYGVGSGGGYGLQVGVMQLLNGTAELANGSHQVALDLGSTIPGVAAATLTVAIGERPQSTVDAVAPGASVKTAQVRLLLDVRLPAPLGLGTVRLPLYVSVAQAEAKLATITCPWSSSDQLTVTVLARPGLLDAAVADVSANAIASTGSPPSLASPALLLDAPLVQARGSSRLTVEAPNARELVFGQGDIDGGRVRTVTTVGIAGSLATSLLTNLAIDVRVAGLGLPVPTIQGALAGAVTSVAPALDAVLDTALQTLGIGVGQADVSVDAVRCGRAVLVQ